MKVNIQKMKFTLVLHPRSRNASSILETKSGEHSAFSYPRKTYATATITTKLISPFHPCIYHKKANLRSIKNSSFDFSKGKAGNAECMRGRQTLSALCPLKNSFIKSSSRQSGGTIIFSLLSIGIIPIFYAHFERLSDAPFFLYLVMVSSSARKTLDSCGIQYVERAHILSWSPKFIIEIGL